MLISFLAGYFEYVFLLIIIIIIHEFGHMFGSIIMRFNSSNIEIFPFGGITKYNELLNIDIKKEFFALICGPIFQILFFILISFFYKSNLVMEHTYETFKNINILLLSFNMLPIIPLDGSKLLNIVLNICLPYKKSINVSIIISIISLLLIIIYEKNILIVLISIVLIKEITILVKDKNTIYNKFLLERYLYFFDFKKGKDINSIIKIKRNRKHNIKINDRIYTEKEYLRNYFDK